MKLSLFPCKSLKGIGVSHNNDYRCLFTGAMRFPSVRATGIRSTLLKSKGTMKATAVLSLLTFSAPAIGVEVHLICKAEDHGLIHEIRFDEEASTLFYRSTFDFISKHNSEDGWVPAVKTEFNDQSIMAEFKVTGSARLSYLGVIDDVEGVLNRYTGMWRIKEQEFTGTVMVPGITFQCEKQEISERKF